MIYVVVGQKSFEGVVWGTDGRYQKWIRSATYKGDKKWDEKVFVVEGAGTWKAVGKETKEEAETLRTSLIDEPKLEDHLIVIEERH